MKFNDFIFIIFNTLLSSSALAVSEVRSPTSEKSSSTFNKEYFNTLLSINKNSTG